MSVWVFLLSVFTGLDDDFPSFFFLLSRAVQSFAFQPLRCFSFLPSLHTHFTLLLHSHSFSSLLFSVSFKHITSSYPPYLAHP